MRHILIQGHPSCGDLCFADKRRLVLLHADQGKQQKTVKRSDAGKPLGNYLTGIKHYVQVSCQNTTGERLHCLQNAALLLYPMIPALTFDVPMLQLPLITWVQTGCLGHGTFGIVIKALDLRSDPPTEVAIKLLPRGDFVSSLHPLSTSL